MTKAGTGKVGRPRKVPTEAVKKVTYSLPVRVVRLLDGAYWKLQVPRQEIVSRAIELYLGEQLRNRE